MEIKYRVYDPAQNKFIEPSKFFFNANFSARQFQGDAIIVKESHSMKCIISQFTGFTDKNKQEIYKGDILGDWQEVDGKKVQSRMQVFFDDKLGQWMLDCSSEQDKSISYALFKELEDFEYEIIGNIYEK